MSEQRLISTDIVALAQHVELNGSGWLDTAIRKAVRFLFWMMDTPCSPDAIFEQRSNVGLESMSRAEMASAVDALVKAGVLLSTGEGRYKLAEQEATALKDAVVNAQDVERQVRDKVLAAAVSAGANFAEEKHPEIWDSFHREFIAPFVSEFGARAYELVTGVTPDAKKAQFVTEFLARFPHEQKTLLEPMILALLDKNSSECRIYVLRMMNSYFFQSAIKLPNSTIEKAFSSNKQNRSLRFVLDTNFLFSLFDLHENPANEAVGLLVATIAKLPRNFNIGMYVLPITVLEFRRSLTFYESQIRAISPTRGVVSAGLQYKMSGVLNTYFKKLKDSGYKISAEDYFRPYFENINAILESKNLKILHKEDDYYATDQATIDDATEQFAFIKQKFPNDQKRQKTWEQVFHDMVLLHYVSDRRKAICDTVFDAEWLGVTIDRGLLAFDNRKRHAKGIPFVVDPAALVQVLQFLIPTDEDLEKTILALMQMPFLVEPFDINDEKITHRILGTISRFENVGDLDKETVLSILGSQALRNKIERVQDKDEELSLVKEALIEYTAELKREADRAANELAETTRRHEEERTAKELALTEVNRQKAEAEQSLETARLDARKSQEGAEALKARVHELEKQQAETERDRRRRLQVTKVVAAFSLFFTLSAGLIFGLAYFPDLISGDIWWMRYFVGATAISIMALPFYWFSGRQSEVLEHLVVKILRRFSIACWSGYVTLVLAVTLDWASGAVQKDLPDPESLMAPPNISTLTEQEN